MGTHTLLLFVCSFVCLFVCFFQEDNNLNKAQPNVVVAARSCEHLGEFKQYSERLCHDPPAGTRLLLDELPDRASQNT